MDAKLYTLASADPTGQVTLPEGVFDCAWKPALVKQVLVAQQANARRPWAHAKNRGEVSGTGKKPWQQKGTGRARHGSRRSPIWVGGGVSHGPRNDRDYSQKVNAKMRQAAIRSVLSKRLADSEVKVMSDFAVATPKTKELFAKLSSFLALAPRAKKVDVLIVRNPEDATVTRIGRNLVKAKITSPVSLNVYDLLNYRTILIDQGALPVLAERYGSTK